MTTTTLIINYDATGSCCFFFTSIRNKRDNKRNAQTNGKTERQSSLFSVVHLFVFEYVLYQAFIYTQQIFFFAFFLSISLSLVITIAFPNLQLPFGNVYNLNSICRLNNTCPFASRRNFFYFIQRRESFYSVQRLLDLIKRQ